MTLREQLEDLLARNGASEWTSSWSEGNRAVQATVYSVDGSYLSGDGADGDIDEARVACERPDSRSVLVDLYQDGAENPRTQTFHLYHPANQPTNKE